MADYTLSLTENSTVYEISFTEAARGPAGPTGPTGPTGSALELTSGPVTSSGGVSAIADMALTISMTGGLQSALDGKAASAHTHVSADITDATSDEIPNKMVIRDSLGRAKFTSGIADFTAAVTGTSPSNSIGVKGQTDGSVSNAAIGVYGYASSSGTAVAGDSVLGNHADFGSGKFVVANNGNTTLTGTIAASNLSGINTGDQDLSGKLDATNAAVNAAIAENPAATRSAVGLSDSEGKIPAELFPSTLVVDSVGLTDTSAGILESGHLGLNSANELVVHDGKTTGGISTNGLRLVGSKKWTTPDSMATAHVLDIASVMVPPDAIFESGYQSLMGTASLYFNCTNYAPASDIRLALYWADQTGDPLTVNAGWVALDAGAVATIECALTLNTYTNMSLSGGYVSLSSPGRLINNRKTVDFLGAATNTDIAFSSLGTVVARRVPYDGTVSRLLKLALILPADPATADASVLVHVSADILLQLYTP